MRVLAFLLVASVARADEPCFDLRAPVVAALCEAPRGAGDVLEKGARPDGTTWAALRGEVRQPLSSVLRRVLNHETFRDPSVDEVRVEQVEAPLVLARHRVRYLVKPFLFIEVRWTEDWAYALASGTVEQPEEVVVSYQKVEGSSHLHHFCGSLVLRRLGPGVTEVSQYEESRIDQHSVQDTVEGLELVLRRLRAKAPERP